MITTLVCILPLICLAIGLGLAILSLRYGIRQTTLVVVLALSCGVIAAVIVRVNFCTDDYEYNEDEAYPAQEWRKIVSLNATPTRLAYRPNEGLFVATNQAESKIADALPACLTDSLYVNTIGVCRRQLS